VASYSGSGSLSQTYEVEITHTDPCAENNAFDTSTPIADQGHMIDGSNSYLVKPTSVPNTLNTNYGINCGSIEVTKVYDSQDPDS
jgi:hypothetical protein